VLEVESVSVAPLYVCAFAKFVENPKLLTIGLAVVLSIVIAIACGVKLSLKLTTYDPFSCFATLETL
jgi:hypothetical protein